LIPFDHKKPDFDSKLYTKKYGHFIKAWKWFDEKGNWIFCTAYYKNPVQGKDFFQNKKTIIEKNFKTFIYKNNEWEISNDIFSFYNIKEIQETKKPIVIVDNEFCIDILNKTNKEDFTFTTWNGDVSIIEKLDFSIFKNKTVYYFSSSWVLSKNIINYIKEKKIDIVIVPPMVERPGWNIVDDIEDMHLDRETIRAWIQIEKKELSKDKPSEDIKFPFKILGPGNGYMYFLHGETGQIYRVKQGTLSNSNLTYLAPLEFWRDEFGYETKRGISISWMDAQDVINRKLNNKPPFDQNKIRGRGIWRDGEKLVIHTGRNLIIGETKIDVRKYSPNGHIYERTNELKLNIDKVEINEFEISNIKECVQKLSISTELEKLFLLGWCVLAPFGGALEWRPHIWITGPAGSGKTAIIQMIILKILGDFVLYAEGGSTGAGVIQNLKNDSFPVVHDEVDKNKKTKDELRFELDISRSSSSSKGNLLKGTADHIGKRFNFNSMFCFSSINHLLEKKSDKSRISLVNLTRNRQIDWKDFRNEIRQTFNNETCQKIRSRVFYNFPIFQENIKNFCDVCGVYCNDQRIGDQIGTLLAGAFTLYHLKNYTENEINKICEKYIKDINTDDDNITDELELLLKIFTTKIQYIGYDSKREDTTLFNLLQRAAGMENNTPDIIATKELLKYGIKYDKNKIYIAYNYEWIKNILIQTMWYNNYGQVLKRLSFAEQRTEVCHFSSWYHGRAVILKAENVLRLSDDKIYMEAGF
jgi:putative DNA primase/helicase